MNGKHIIPVLVACCSVALQAQEGDWIPGQVHVSPTVDLELQPMDVEGLEGRVLNLPSGFKVNVFAENLGKARLMAWSPDSVLHVVSMTTSSPNNEWNPDPDRTSRILALPDRDRDGVADEVIVAADGLWWPNDVDFYNGDMYVSDTHQVVRLSDADGDGVYEERSVFIDDLATFQPGGGAQHVTHSIVIDEAKGKIYVHVGSSCDLCRESDPERATILEFNLDGSGRRIFARGLRNSIGMALHPVTGQLWANNNGHDRDNFPDRDGFIGGDLPPEWVGIVRDGGFYGWPLAHGYQVWVDFGVPQYFNSIAPFAAQDTLDVLSMEPPIATLPAHTAPMELHFYTGDLFPAQYRNAAFVALRAGSRGNDPGYKVVAVFSEPDGSNARTAEFLTGFRPNPNNNTIWGKPVGLQSDAAGHLYLSSDHTTQAVFRIGLERLFAVWTQALPDSIIGGVSLDVTGELALEKLVEGGAVPVARADLSAFGIEEEVVLASAGDQLFRLTTDLGGAAQSGLRRVQITIEQETDAGLERIRLSKNIVVLPPTDLVVLDDQLDPLWESQTQRGIGQPSFNDAGPVAAGTVAAVLEARPLIRSRLWIWTMLASQPVDPIGYKALRFAFHPGDVVPQEGDRIELLIQSGRQRGMLEILDGAARDYGLDLSVKEWQVVEIPLAEFGDLANPITALQISGNLEGQFFMDDLRLVTAATDLATTAVVEERDDRQPQDFALEQNFPNPFNSETVIRFTLPQAAAVDLAIYNLAGQKVASLVRGMRPAGGYTVRWDGRDAQGRLLATGTYLYRLRAGAVEQTRKLLLLR